MHRTLVSTDTLAANLGTWVVVDCRFDLQNGEKGRADYLAAHISGAVYASLNDDLAGERTGQNGRHPVPPEGALAAAFGRWGIAPGTQVVVYDQDTGLYASRLWWSLRSLGHDAVALLDGGWAKWMWEGRATRSGEESNTPAMFEVVFRRDTRVTVDEVEAGLGGTARLLVDARAPERFEGRSEAIDRVAGHIPGAVNRFYKSNLADDGTMLPPETLRRAYTALLGEVAPEDVVMYCGSGVTACHNLLAMEHAGLSGSKLYVGSWSEWSSDPARSIETGPAK
jgi:thiosulfate/3-mercaptopyruvate sulfurtransferase